LKRVSLIKNDFRPVFNGRIEARQGAAALVGTFSVNASVISSLKVAVGFGLLWSCGATLSIAIRGWGDLPWWFPFVGIGIAAGLVCIARIGYHLSQRDIDWMQDRIRQTFAGYVP